MHVMRVHIADLKLWSANDRRTGGKAVPIKEQGRAHQGALLGHGISVVCRP